MASSQDFLQAARLHGLKPRFPPSNNYSGLQKIVSGYKSSWPQAKISFKASSQDFLQAATIHGLKPTNKLKD
jgi:hypothetical protein